MLFHVKQNPDVPDPTIGYPWLDVLAIEPMAICANDADLGPWAEKIVSCWLYTRCPDGFLTLSSLDLQIADNLESAQEAGCEYYLAQKEQPAG